MYEVQLTLYEIGLLVKKKKRALVQMTIYPFIKGGSQDEVVDSRVMDWICNLSINEKKSLKWSGDQ